MQRELRNKTAKRMEGAVESFRRELASVRTGRASVGLLEGITVEYYGAPTPLKQVAALSVPESRLIVIQPWEPRLIADIERAIMKSDLGLTPTNDGKVIRVPVPPLTEERRKELVRLVRKKAEEARVAVRNIRRDVNETLKRMEKQEHISQDETKRALEEVQKLTDEYIKKIDEILQRKEKEIMEV
jgi:ribosome recycling factor